MTAPVLVWFRDDLRLNDHPALAAAAASSKPLIAIYVLDEVAERALGGASRWWLHGSLAALASDLAVLGATLLLKRGRAEAVILQLAHEAGASAVHWNRRYRQAAVACDAKVATALKRHGIAAEIAAGDLLFEPEALLSGGGQPFGVFTPFWRACRAAPAPAIPLPAPKRLRAPDRVPASDELASWRLRPEKPNWAAGVAAAWVPGERAARERLRKFLSQDLPRYDKRRDLAAEDGTSRLSPHLRFGELSPRQLWHAVRMRPTGNGGEAFLRELGWREFAHHTLAREPDMAVRPLRAAWARFPWRRDPGGFRAWQRGRTGYPFIDAAMRELWATGFMPNRARMAAASFLVKHLLVPWQEGEAWFWDTLCDADPANNALNWQWVAGAGIDAAPYFRIFNPVLQGRKFDPAGDYVRRWVPELGAMPARHIHEPWQAPEEVLRRARVSLGRTYPLPVVDHDMARRRALAAFAAIRNG